MRRVGGLGLSREAEQGHFPKTEGGESKPCGYMKGVCQAEEQEVQRP